MSDSQDLARLVREAVKQELSSKRLKSPELISGGDVTIASTGGNVHLRSGRDGKVFANGIEVGTGSGGSGTIDGSGTAGYLPKFLDSNTLANSKISDDGSNASVATDFLFHSAAKAAFYSPQDTLGGQIYITSTDVEGGWHKGILISPQNTIGTSPGNIYIGDFLNAPAGQGIKVHDSRIDILAITGAYVNIGVNSVSKLAVSATQVLAAVQIHSDVTTGTAPITVDSTTVCTNLNADTLDGNEATAFLLKSGGEMSGNITFAGAQTVDGIDISAHAADVTTIHLPSQSGASGKYLKSNGTIASWETVSAGGDVYLASDNIFTGDHQTIRGAGGSEPNYPTIQMRNTTFSASDKPVITVTDTGLVQVGSDGWANYVQILGGLKNTNFVSDGSMTFKTNATPVTRLTIADSLITSDVPITMSTTNAINFSDTNTKIVRSGSNLDIHAGGAWKIGVTSTYVDFSVAITPSVTDSKDIGTSSYYWNNAYIKTLYIDDASTKIDNNTGNMRLTVATGKVFEFVVSPA